MSSPDANENDQKHGASDRVMTERKIALEKVDVNVLRNIAEASNICMQCLGFIGTGSSCSTRKRIFCLLQLFLNDKKIASVGPE